MAGVLLLGELRVASAQATCNSDALRTTCVSRLGDGFHFLKSYLIDSDNGTRDKVEYSYVFTRGTMYQINLCMANEAGPMTMVSILDGSRNKMATNKTDTQWVPVISFLCNATGIYYLQYTLENGASCAGSALGFQRPLKE